MAEKESELTPIMNAAGLIAIHAALAVLHQDAAALIATHAGLPTVHQDASALATALIATHAALATVHQNAPGLIATHSGLPTVHQDAPALIATHSAIAGVHHAKILATTGNYSGNDSANRAIPHGLGATPKMVMILRRISDSGMFLIFLLPGLAFIFSQNGANGMAYAVTTIDSTNFYVGNASSYNNSGNENGQVHYWSAIG